MSINISATNRSRTLGSSYLFGILYQSESTVNVLRDRTLAFVNSKGHIEIYYDVSP